MNWNDYRKAMDTLPFSAGFQERTEELVRRKARTEKECITMKKRGLYRTLTIAAAAALLTVSAYAASRWLSPAQVADIAGNPALAQAFESTDAVTVNQTVHTGSLSVTLAGLVSGEGLSNLTDQADQAHTYAVIILESLDGTPLDGETFPFLDYTVTPMVAGFAPWSVNNWTLDSGVTGFARDGVYYYLLDVKNLEMFADHTVYLAFYEGRTPSKEIFTVAQDGTISFAESFEAPHALFTLPLEQSKADAAAEEQFIQDSGLEPEWFTNFAPAASSQPTA